MRVVSNLHTHIARGCADCIALGTTHATNAATCLQLKWLHCGCSRDPPDHAELVNHLYGNARHCGPLDVGRNR